ncbi:MAG: hypothetical protein JNK76_05615 [Planctomycetales bacterium]|nr:hypothetical protein [Planctomycetales bacterium]
MREFLLVICSIALTAVCWGVYGPIMRNGQAAMSGSHLLPFVWVGLAYCVIAVVVPGVLMRLWGEKGSWTASGFLWSFVAGVAGALGALGIILAFTFGGSPVYVMPLVFGGAPVVNTFTSMYMSKSYKNASPLFYAGLILVVVGALCVLFFKPTDTSAAAGGAGIVKHAVKMLEVGLSIGLTVLSWGVYGPILHKGQMLMQGSRLRPLICVGLAYFAVAVVATAGIIQVLKGSAEWDLMTTKGSIWSFAGGAAGAVGALGIILAFTFGGKPTYVMPLVFGGAPVINTLVTIGPGVANGTIAEISPLFFAGLIIVIAGAATVLVFAPKGAPHAPAR